MLVVPVPCHDLGSPARQSEEVLSQDPEKALKRAKAPVRGRGDPGFELRGAAGKAVNDADELRSYRLEPDRAQIRDKRERRIFFAAADKKRTALKRKP